MPLTKNPLSRIQTPGVNIDPTQPICKVRLLTNIPLDNSYNDTLDFATKANQLIYFTAHAKHSWDDFTPVRMQNKIRVPVNVEDCYNCNYLMWQNTNYGAKWYYAFITGMDYINPNMTEISYEIDVLQTWMYDWELNECMIEREHTKTDNWGEHTLIEPINPGQYVLEQSLTDTDLLDMRLICQYAPSMSTGVLPQSLDDNPVDTPPDEYPTECVAQPDPGFDAPAPRAVGKMQGGFYSGLLYMSTPMTSSGAMGDFLEGLINTGKAGNVVATYVMPSLFYTTDADSIKHTIHVPLAENKNAIGKYVPKNKKVLIYPYNMLQVSNSQGQVRNLRWEYFAEGENCAFTATCAMGTNPEVVLYPLNYNGQGVNQDETLILSGYPQFAFAIDTYRAYLAQNSSSLLVAGADLAFNTAMAASGLGSATKTKDIISAGMGVYQGVKGIIEESINLGQHAKEPNTASGTQNCASAIAARHHNFFFSVRHITEEYAKCVDDYFTMFGYLVNRVGKPELRTRPEFNYVKTVGCAISGSIPFNDLAKIKTIFNNGIRFWHNGVIGNYSADNSV